MAARDLAASHLILPHSHCSEGERGVEGQERRRGCNFRVRVSPCGHCGRRDGREKVGIVGTMRG